MKRAVPVPDRTAWVGFRCRPHERAALEGAAMADQERLTEWVRSAAVNAAKRRIAEEKR
jgi:uncharacterized protein (DUF1778 family)